MGFLKFAGCNDGDIVDWAVASVVACEVLCLNLALGINPLKL